MFPFDPSPLGLHLLDAAVRARGLLVGTGTGPRIRAEDLQPHEGLAQTILRKTEVGHDC